MIAPELTPGMVLAAAYVVAGLFIYCRALVLA